MRPPARPSRDGVDRAGDADRAPRRAQEAARVTGMAQESGSGVADRTAQHLGEGGRDLGVGQGLRSRRRPCCLPVLLRVEQGVGGHGGDVADVDTGGGAVTQDHGAIAGEAEVLGGVGGDPSGRHELSLARPGHAGASPTRSSIVDRKYYASETSSGPKAADYFGGCDDVVAAALKGEVPDKVTRGVFTALSPSSARRRSLATLCARLIEVYSAYIESRSPWYLPSTTLRLTFMLGVSSSASTDRSWSRMRKSLMVSQRLSRPLSSATLACT